ncbi:hypothetical protein ACUSIJ_21820 [Pseudochelatococcus sp. B33]
MTVAAACRLRDGGRHFTVEKSIYVSYILLIKNIFAAASKQDTPQG